MACPSATRHPLSVSTPGHSCTASTRARRRDLAAEVVVGDLLGADTVRPAREGMSSTSHRGRRTVTPRATRVATPCPRVAATPVVAALLPEGHSGPVETEHEQVAVEFTKELGRKIVFRGLPVDDYTASLNETRVGVRRAAPQWRHGRLPQRPHGRRRQQHREAHWAPVYARRRVRPGPRRPPERQQQLTCSGRQLEAAPTPRPPTRKSTR